MPGYFGEKQNNHLRVWDREAKEKFDTRRVLLSSVMHLFISTMKKKLFEVTVNKHSAVD